MGPEADTSMVRNLETFIHKERLREVRFFSLEKTRLSKTLLQPLNVCRGFKERQRIFKLLTKACSDWTKDIGLKMKDNNFRLNIKNIFFFFRIRVMLHGNSLPREGADVPSLKVFKAQLEGAWSNLV